MRPLPLFKIGPVIILLFLFSCAFGAHWLAENIHVPGISNDIFRWLILAGTALAVSALYRLIPVSISFFFKQRQLRLAGIMADLNAGIAATIHPCSAQAAHALANQAEIARELLLFSKAQQLGEKALNTATAWAQFVNTPVPNSGSAIGKKVLEANLSQQKTNSADIVALCHESLAGTLLDMGQYDEALNHARNAVAIADEGITNTEISHPTQRIRWVFILISALSLKGRVKMTQGAHDEARADLERAVSLIPQLNGQFSEFITSAYAYLASTYSMQGENEKAERAISAGLNMIEGSTMPLFELTKATLLQHQGECLIRNGRTEETGICLNKCLQIRQKLLAKDHPEIDAIAETFGRSSGSFQHSG